MYVELEHGVLELFWFTVVSLPQKCMFLLTRMLSTMVAIGNYLCETKHEADTHTKTRKAQNASRKVITRNSMQLGQIRGCAVYSSLSLCFSARRVCIFFESVYGCGGCRAQPRGPSEAGN